MNDVIIIFIASDQIMFFAAEGTLDYHWQLGHICWHDSNAMKLLTNSLIFNSFAAWLCEMDKTKEVNYLFYNEWESELTQIKHVFPNPFTFVPVITKLREHIFLT